MTKGVPVKHDFAAMCELIIKERKIALPASRLLWYAHWFGLSIKPKTAYKMLNDLVREGTLVKVKDGKFSYYKNRIK